MTQGRKDGFKAVTAKIREITANDECITVDVAAKCDDLDTQIDNEPLTEE